MQVKLILIAACLTLLSACSKTLPTPYVTFPPDLVQKCDPLVQFDGKTADDLVAYVISLTGSYRDCSERHAALADVVVDKP